MNAYWNPPSNPGLIDATVDAQRLDRVLIEQLLFILWFRKAKISEVLYIAWLCGDFAKWIRGVSDLRFGSRYFLSPRFPVAIRTLNS